jgi:outer membrane receptor protein involved in Fe transport
LCYVFFTGITGQINGYVYDQETGLSLPYANITIKDTQLGASTDNSGNFFILQVVPGSYAIEVSYIGYQTQIIENVTIEVDHTVRLKIGLKSTFMEMNPVIIRGTTPSVKQDMIGSTYVIRRDEIQSLPLDFMEKFISLQPSVANMDTALHVRGGRATEVMYMIDNVPIIDPLTGEPAITIARDAIDEIIFTPGGFDVEYGRAMSGVVNMISEYPGKKFAVRLNGKTETTMPFSYSTGYWNSPASIQGPFFRSSRGIVSCDLVHVDDWEPRRKIMPHEERNDYALYGKYLYNPSQQTNITLSGALSRSQFDRYARPFYFNLNHYRSDFRKGNLVALNINYLPDAKKLFNLTLSRLETNKKQGVRELEPSGFFNDFQYQPVNSYRYPHGGVNPYYGVYYYRFRLTGDYPEYQDKKSIVYKMHLSSHVQLNKIHALKSGVEYNYLDINNYGYFLSSDSLNPLIDNWHYHPLEYAAYFQDNITRDDLFMKIGVRLDYFSSRIHGYNSNLIISPRAGFSFLVTEKWLFRANIGKYVQPPLYDNMYKWFGLLPFPTYMNYLFGTLTDNIVGNPGLRPEQTMSYEIGMQGEIRTNLYATINAFYKEMEDLTGVHYGIYPFRQGFSYFNIDHANSKGIETIYELTYKFFTGKISYTLSWSRGTSSYASDVYWNYYKITKDTLTPPPAGDYYLDFDQRHRFIIQGIFSLSEHIKVNLLGYFGQGFPYTPPGEEGKTYERNVLRNDFRKQMDAIISFPFSILKSKMNISLEIVNALNIQYQVEPMSTWYNSSLIDEGDFGGPITIDSPYYHPAADLNHDGIETPHEMVMSWIALNEFSRDTDNSYSSPHRVRIGFNFKF